MDNLQMYKILIIEAIMGNNDEDFLDLIWKLSLDGMEGQA